MLRRYVLLRHSGHGPTHYDLMIESGGRLATWRLAKDPAEVPHDATVACRRIAPHRRAYLTYEGPVSRGRGEVVRLDEGDCELDERPDGGVRIAFRGGRLRGAYEILPGEEGLRMRRSAAPGLSQE